MRESKADFGGVFFGNRNIQLGENPPENIKQLSLPAQLSVCGLLVLSIATVVLQRTYSRDNFSSYFQAKNYSEALFLGAVAFMANWAIILWDGADSFSESDSAFIPILLAVLCYDVFTAFAIALVSSLPYFAPGGEFYRHRIRAYHRLCCRLLMAALCSLLYAYLSHHMGNSATDFVYRAAAIIIFYQLGQLLLHSLLVAISYGGSWHSYLAAIWQDFSLALLIFGPLTIAYAYLLPKFPYFIILAVFSVISAQNFLGEARRSRENQRILNDLSVDIPAALLRALDVNDSYTARHSASVASYARDIAQQLDLTPEQVHQMHLTGLLHDIGKIGVSDQILNKPGRLDPEEKKAMEKHAELGAKILSNIPGFSLISEGVLHHHERLNGAGYPSGLAGNTIPISSQIIAVADTYSAITTTRSYRSGGEPELAISELQREAERGSLSAKLVKLFVAILEESSDEYRRGKHSSLEKELELAKLPSGSGKNNP